MPILPSRRVNILTVPHLSERVYNRAASLFAMHIKQLFAVVLLVGVYRRVSSQTVHRLCRKCRAMHESWTGTDKDRCDKMDVHITPIALEIFSNGGL